MKTSRIITLALFVAASTAHSQQATLRFDIVTVKPSDPTKEHEAMYWRQPDGLKWDGVTLSGMIANAYGVSGIVRGQIEGGPVGWARGHSTSTPRSMPRPPRVGSR